MRVLGESVNKERCYMQERKGKLTDEMQTQEIQWEKIFENPENIFTLEPNEYSSVESLRSSGIGYRHRHGYSGVLHVLVGEEGSAQVQFEPAGTTASRS